MKNQEIILVTGFAPYGDYPFNPTQDAAKYFDNKVFGNRRVIGVTLSPTYFDAFAQLVPLMMNTKPHAIISTGLSSTVHCLRIESTFHNNMHHEKYADATGFRPRNLPIIEDSPYTMKAKSSSVDIFKMLQQNNIPAELSVYANSFVCNALGYQTSAAIFENKLKTKNVFVHVPWTSEYSDKIVLEKGKIFLKKEIVYKVIELLIKNI